MSQSFSGIGSTVTVDKLTEFVRHAAQELQAFDQLCNAPTGAALGRNRGDTVNYVFYPNLSTTGGAIAENSEMPQGSLVPVTGSYTLAEYGNSTTWTGKLDMLAELPVEDSFIQALIDDMHKAQNTAAYTEFNSSDWIATFNSTADEFRTDGTAASFTNVANEQLSLANLRYVVVKARQNLIPYFDGESYVYVSGIESLDAVRYDSTVTTALGNASSDSGRAALNGEVGRLAQCRLVEDNHKTAKVGGSSSGAGLLLDTGYLIGADAVINEYALPPEIRAQDKDYGRSLGVAWYFIGAWRKIYDQTLHSKEHIIRVVSK